MSNADCYQQVIRLIDAIHLSFYFNYGLN